MLISNCKTTSQHLDKKVWRQLVIRISLKTLGTDAIADVLLHVHILAKTWEIERDQKRKWQSYIFGTVMTLGLPVKNSFWRPLTPWVGILILCQLLCHATVRVHLELLYQSQSGRPSTARSDIAINECFVFSQEVLLDFCHHTSSYPPTWVVNEWCSPVF